MALSDDQKKRYESMNADTKKEISEIEDRIEEEMAKVRERLAELQNSKAALLQMYGATCMLLGIPNDMEEEEVEG